MSTKPEHTRIEWSKDDPNKGTYGEWYVVIKRVGIYYWANFMVDGSLCYGPHQKSRTFAKSAAQRFAKRYLKPGN